MKQKVKEINNNDIYQKIWLKNFNLLREYVESHDGQFPPHSKDSLFYFLDTQKRRFSKGTLSPERKALLDTLGDWNFGADYENRWNAKFNQLKDYVERYDAFPKSKEGELGCWLVHQRQCLVNNKLSNKRIERLDSLGDWRGYTMDDKKNKDLKNETNEKLKRYQETHDESIKKEIVLDNMRLVFKVLRSMKLSVANPDLLQAGYLGLITAVDKYDFSKGAFPSYAFCYISGNIKKELYFLNGVSRTYADFYKVLREVEEEYGESLLDNPNLAIITAQRLVKTGRVHKNYYEETVRKILVLKPCSLEELEEDQNCYNLGYEVNDSDINSVYDNEAAKIINEQVSELTGRRKEIVELYYGLNGNDPHSMYEIASILGISKQAVSMHLKNANEEFYENSKVRRLKRYLHREV